MSHIRDLWFTDGQPTSRHNHGFRWKACWIDADKKEHCKSFARKIDAEQYLAVKEQARIRAELLLAADGDGIDPAGYYVYLLWAVPEDAKPLYVGSSGNILSRLGSHLGSTAKRSRVGWVTLIRCTSEKAMLRREGELIRKYRPEWNKEIPLANGKKLRVNGLDVAPPSGVELAEDESWQRLKAEVHRATARARARSAQRT
jgi:GIY-YIG catalytic domain